MVGGGDDTHHSSERGVSGKKEAVWVNYMGAEGPQRQSIASQRGNRDLVDRTMRQRPSMVLFFLSFNVFTKKRGKKKKKRKRKTHIGPAATG